MSKLIVCTGTLAAGGAERVLSILSKPFADAFDEVQYMMWLDAKYPNVFYRIDPRVKIVRMYKESGSTAVWKQMIWFRKYVKRESPDLVLSFMVMVCFTVTIALLCSGTKQVVAERNDPRFFKKKWLRKLINWSYLSPEIKGVLMQTEWNRNFFTNKKLLDKTSVIYNPIDIDSQYVGSALKSEKENVVVSVGRLTDQKQYNILLRAFAIFHISHPEYKLIIYGEGERRSSLVETAVQLGIEKCVLLPGRVKNIPEVIQSAQMFVMTSKYEGMSNALVEAMCIGLPCISTKVSGATDLIKNQENGILVDVGDVEGISKAMSAIADDITFRQDLAKEAVRLYGKLNSQIISNQWINYLRDCGNCN